MEEKKENLTALVYIPDGVFNLTKAALVIGMASTIISTAMAITMVGLKLNKMHKERKIHKNVK